MYFEYVYIRNAFQETVISLLSLFVKNNLLKLYHALTENNGIKAKIIVLRHFYNIFMVMCYKYQNF